MEPNTTASDLGPRERILGSLLGLAAGDALGWPHEFTSTFGQTIGLRLNHRDDYPAAPSWLGANRVPSTNARLCAQWTDDTQMTICVAEAMLRGAVTSSVNSREQVMQEFLAWGYSPENNRAPGSTVMGALSRARGGASITTCGANDSKGSGTVMRSAPYGWILPPALAGEVAAWHATTTHGHPAAHHAAGGLAVIVSCLVRGQTFGDGLAEALRQMPSGDCHRKVSLALEMANGSPGERRSRSLALGEKFLGWCADDALALAVGLAKLFPLESDVEAGILFAANTPGDSDTNGCVLGAILGAMHGAAALPWAWRRDIEKPAYLRALAERCYKRAELS